MTGAGGYLAEREGFEPSWDLRPRPISSRCRYGRFGTSPSNYRAHTHRIRPGGQS